MRAYRTRNRRQRIFVVAMMLGLLLQVQVVFACEMMEAAGPVQECCCDHARTTEEQPDVDADSCCDFNSELTIKGGGSDKEPPAVLPKHPSHEQPESSPYLVLAAIWPEDDATKSIVPSFGVDSIRPGASGTKTYLSTLRLRI